MSTDLVSVLDDGTLRDYTEELTLMLSRSVPEAQQSEWSDALLKEAATIDEETDADAAAQKTRALLTKLVEATPAALEGTDREIEGLFNLLMTLVVRNFQGEEQGSRIMRLANTVGDAQSASAAERSILKYRILANLFNALPAKSAYRLEVFETFLKLVSVNGDMEYLQTALDSLPTWLAQWNVTAEQKNACLDMVSDALQGPDCGPEWVTKAYQYSLLHLRYLANESSLSTDHRKAEAEKILANVFRLPKLFELEELMNVCVSLGLEGEPIFLLLKVFVAGTHADFAQWKSQNQSVLDRVSLDADALSRKMRLLDLASLCARSVSSEVSYAEIAQVLDVDQEEVEAWVIDVIRAGLVSGKLSQVKRSFRVYRSTHRTFEKPQWEALEQRLTQWQKSIQNLITTLKST
ncbi:hypothetical protein MPSI1_001534 [Malassezia psittaci]|uniref:Eukaryotic translation initiation factor 3 subunit M n=1 Tax=Malassezia psittaci TaxID=1821823 RepID=A0AAF0JDZ3_9BASI|nr:hypothetical protein MPSI1_001534 [Malassezia psittaci]